MQHSGHAGATRPLRTRTTQEDSLAADPTIPMLRIPEELRYERICLRRRRAAQQRLTTALREVFASFLTLLQTVRPRRRSPLLNPLDTPESASTRRLRKSSASLRVVALGLLVGVGTMNGFVSFAPRPVAKNASSPRALQRSKSNPLAETPVPAARRPHGAGAQELMLAMCVPSALPKTSAAAVALPVAKAEAPEQSQKVAMKAKEKHSAVAKSMAKVSPAPRESHTRESALQGSQERKKQLSREAAQAERSERVMTRYVREAKAQAAIRSSMASAQRSLND